MSAVFGGPQVVSAVLAVKASATPDNTATIDLGPFYNDFAEVLAIIFEREGQTGAANTVDVKPMWKPYEGYTSYIDFADATGAQIAFEQWATTDTGVKMIIMGMGVLGGDADDVLTADAGSSMQQRRYGGVFIPTGPMIIRITQTQAVGKSNTYNCTVMGKG